MGFDLPGSELIHSTFTWCVLSAAFFGAAASRATRRSGGRNEERERHERAVSLKWTWVSLLLSISVLLALTGVFVPGPEKVRDIRLLYVFLAASALFFLAFRFKRAAGLPVLVLGATSAVLLLLLLRSLVAFTGETEIARIRVLATSQQRMTLEVVPRDEEPVIAELDGEYFAPIVKVIIFDDAYVFLGSKTWYRFVGVTSFRVERTDDGFRFRQQDTDLYFKRAAGISENLYGLFERYEEHIPGVKSVQVEIDLKRVREAAAAGSGVFETFDIMLQNDGGVQIVRRR